MKDLTVEEVEAMLLKSGQERYVYTIKRIAEHEEAWTLKTSDGIVATEDEDGSFYFPVWPSREYALKCKIEEWENCELVKLPITILIEVILPGLSRAGTQVVVFNVPNDPVSTIVSADDFSSNILHECSK